MQQPQPISGEDKLKAFDSVPLFMRSLPDDDNIAINALQSLIHEGTPDETAENFKEQGNDYFKGRRFKEARDFYTQGIDAKPTDPKLLESLRCNRAACNLELKNYGFVLRDCSEAISLNSQSSKAYYRSALALVALERYEEALDCCTRCLSFNPENESIRSLLDRARKGEKAKAEKQRRLEEEAVRKQDLANALKARHIIQVNDPSSESSPYEASLEGDEPKSLIVPVFFLYPQHATSDLISHYHEDTPFSTHLENMFPISKEKAAHPPPNWDTRREYLAPNLAVYAMTHQKRLLKVGKKMTLRDVCRAAGTGGRADGLELKNGCFSVVVLPKGDVEQHWVDNFKANRA